MREADLLRILEQLRATRFRDLAGTRMAASIPIGETLLNALVAASLPRSANIRQVSVHPQKGNRITVRAKIPQVDFLPPFNVSVEIAEQPELPDSPMVLRLLSFPGLIRLLGTALPIASSLPPGLRWEKDRIYVDLRTLAERHGYGDLLPLVEKLRVTTDDGRLIVQVDVRVPA